MTFSINGENMKTPLWALERIKTAQITENPSLDLTKPDFEIGKPNEQVEPLTVIPKEVLQLYWLEDLDLKRNNISEIDPLISQLKNLSILDLSNNNFSIFPEAIESLSNLRTLLIENNNIEVLPDFIKKLKFLEILSLSENNISVLPEFIMELPNLFYINVKGNPLTIPPYEVAIKGVDNIRQYYNQLLVGQDYLHESKLIIVGEGGAGKTTLANKIKTPYFQLSQDEKSTEGIDVLKWEFTLESGRTFRVNIWDFGGQEIYHTTHQFFLTKRSMYILVADTRKEDTDFYYWLNVVDLLSKGSPLLIVKNEKQDRHRDINERLLRGQFENLKEVLSANLANNRGLDKVVEEIKHHIRGLPHVGSALPKTWIRVREILENDPRNYISLDEYFSICSKNGFVSTENSLQLSGYLHDIGVFLHFQDNALLNKTVILKPKWGTDAVYKVLDNKIVIRNLGVFAKKDLSVVWGEAQYANMHDELLQLMMTFKLCYQIPSTTDTYIAPQLLTENQPIYPWKEEDNLQLRFSYEFMPKGILTQFIVSMHRFIYNQNGQSFVWKSGVVLVKDKTAAEVVEHYGKREIRIRVAGSHKKELMTIIMHELDNIHLTYNKLKYHKLIPCNCNECKPSREPHFYQFERLQKFIEDQQEQIQCQQSYKMIDVKRLVDDVAIGMIAPSNYVNTGLATKYDVKIERGAMVGNIVLGSSIQDSFAKVESAEIGQELKETLKQLAQVVDIASKVMSNDEAKNMTRDFNTLVDESTKNTPRQQWYQLSAAGLIKAAKNIGEIGTPVISLASKVVKLLMMGN